MTVSGTNTAGAGGPDGMRMRTKKPGASSGSHVLKTPRARNVPVAGSSRLSTKSR
jgi:hypothetical protein